MSIAAELELNDPRVEFVADYVLKTMKLKGDKFMKLYNVDENKQMFMDFLEKPEFQSLIVTQSAGSLSVGYEWPVQLKSKACYFVKKGRENVPKDQPPRNVLLYGDLSYSPMDQLSAFVDEVRQFLLRGNVW